MDKGSDRAAVHVCYAITPMQEATGLEKSIDFGITEVATDQDNNKYGQGYGKALVKIAEKINQKGKRRGKLWSLTKKNAGSKRMIRSSKLELSAGIVSEV